MSINRFSMLESYPELVRCLEDPDQPIPLFDADRNVGIVSPLDKVGAPVILTLLSKNRYAAGKLVFEPDIEVIERDVSGKMTKIRVLAFNLVRVRKKR